MADASAVGDGEDITVTVMVAGLEASGSPVKLADVTTGLDIEVTAATGLQCDPSDGNGSHHHVHGRFYQRDQGGGGGADDRQSDC